MAVVRQVEYQSFNYVTIYQANTDQVNERGGSQEWKLRQQLVVVLSHQCLR